MAHPPDDAGFAAWYEKEAPRLTTTVAAAVGDRDRAEEAVAEAFARAYARWRRVAAMASPEGWIVRVAVNHVRGRQRRTATEQRKAPMLATRPEPAPGAVDEELWAAVLELPERSRQAVVLRYVADLPEKEVARIMGVSRGTVATTLSRARASLQDRLTAEEAS
jgi:RNA polymerase sigma-70 factor (sigma-E family)